MGDYETLRRVVPTICPSCHQSYDDHMVDDCFDAEFERQNRLLIELFAKEHEGYPTDNDSLGG